ncbi:hypothetical protein SAMN06295900_106285 [Trinickia caryophylli]|uniref:Uncharacterized protein n=1 Tax=Trinickia caryophylli TaxID=28094 RepID=A0A1X7EU06_TRICW|nr:hypothetical protein SAMN06295900_106285 [Trinickia caryophylli]
MSGSGARSNRPAAGAAGEQEEGNVRFSQEKRFMALTVEFPDSVRRHC